MRSRPLLKGATKKSILKGQQLGLNYVTKGSALREEKFTFQNLTLKNFKP